MNERLKKIREVLSERGKKKLSQADLAKRIGVVQNTYSTYERGITEIPEYAIISICREFNVNETWFRTGEGEMFNPVDKDIELAAWIGSIFNEKNNMEIQKRWLGALRELSPEQWKALDEFICKIAEAKKDKEE